MNKVNQEGFDLFIASLKKKQLPQIEIENYSKYILVYLNDYLDHLTYVEGMTKLSHFFNDYLIEHYPLLSAGMIEGYLKSLKRFYTVMYGKDLLTYEQYAKVFDWLVYQGDAIVEKYKNTSSKIQVKH